MRLISESSEYLQNGFKKSIGFTKITNKGGKLYISHGGNMGNSIKDSVNPNLKIGGIPTIDQLKKKFPKFKEEGSPDYMYSIEFTLPKNEGNLDKPSGANDGYKYQNPIIAGKALVDALKRIDALESKLSSMEKKVSQLETRNRIR